MKGPDGSLAVTGLRAKIANKVAVRTVSRQKNRPGCLKRRPNFPEIAKNAPCEFEVGDYNLPLALARSEC
jgi:hypothetical protein